MVKLLWPVARGCQQSKIVHEVSIFNLFQKYFKIYLVLQNYKYLLKWVWDFNICISKRFDLYFKSLAYHSGGQSVPCGSYNNLNNKLEIMCYNINGGNQNMQFKTWQSNISDFWIFKYLHGFLNGFHRRHVRFC